MAKASGDDKQTVNSLRGLARALERSPGLLSRYSKRPWWPKGPPYDVAQVAAAIEANVQTRRDPPRAPAAPAPTSARQAPGATGAPSSAVEVLRAGSGASPLDRAHAALEVASHRLAVAEDEGGAGPREIESVAKCLTEIRRSVAGWLKLEQDRGQLLPREAAMAACGGAARWALDLVNRVLDALTPQIVTWLEDPEFAALDPSARQAHVRTWCEGQVREERQRLFDELEQRLETEVAVASDKKRKTA